MIFIDFYMILYDFYITAMVPLWYRCGSLPRRASVRQRSSQTALYRYYTALYRPIGNRGKRTKGTLTLGRPAAVATAVSRCWAGLGLGGVGWGWGGGNRDLTILVRSQIEI